MALYYRECSKVFAGEYDFFHDIELQELAHQKNLIFILDRIKQNPEEFSWKMPFEESIVEDGARRMKKAAEEIKNDRFTLKDALNVAMTEERTVMEKNYSDIVETKNEKVSKLLKLIAEETELHYEGIEEKLREIE